MYVVYLFLMMPHKWDLVYDHFNFIGGLTTAKKYKHY